MKTEHKRGAGLDAAALAMQAVLEAEQAAAGELERQREQSARIVEAARDGARILVNRALDRAARRRERYAAALARRVETLRARAVADAGDVPIDLAALERAAERLAARLTGDDATP